MKLLSLNVHKGLSTLGTRVVIHELRDALRKLNPDLVFLQEVIGENHKHRKTKKNWPAGSQYEFLADSVWSEYAYAQNAVYDHGHHGNAILSKFPIASKRNTELSLLQVSRRGLLHCTVEIPFLKKPLHCLCTHLGLFENERRHQTNAIVKDIRENIPDSDPLILAGDFNDWRELAGHTFAEHLGLKEVYLSSKGEHAKSFPSFLPFLKLDRIYIRGLEAKATHTLKGGVWRELSDHLPLFAEVGTL